MVLFDSCCVNGNETELAAEGSRGHCLEVHSKTWHSLPVPHQLEPTQANSVAKASLFLHGHQSLVSGLVSLSSDLMEKLWVNCFSLGALGASG